tara:strand:+ start:499 stop:1749 length:1251 start_codon:yes stop_codon:yes gene_type:complete
MVKNSNVESLGKRARIAAPAIAKLASTVKDEALREVAEKLVDKSDVLLEANQADVEQAQQEMLSETLLDRLRLNLTRIEGMASGLRQVADLEDPVGVIVDSWIRPNGLRLERVRVPLGVVGIIYESRPNVTIDSFSLCFKSGNVAFLRGSSSTLRTNQALVGIVRQTLDEQGIPSDALLFVEERKREVAIEFMRQNGVIDCLIPRGGASLIQSVMENATVPYIIDGVGNCHIYVDTAANLSMAADILVNAKTQRPSVCNAVESLVVHEEIIHEFLPKVSKELSGVQLVGDEKARSVLPDIDQATEEDWKTEYLDLKLSIRVVEDLGEAIAHINDTGTGHSEAIVTEDTVAAERFVKEVDAAAVLVNASTRFVDGEEFGFGAEIGISTQKLHARGPMGLQQLTTMKFIVRGEGHIRI